MCAGLRALLSGSLIAVAVGGEDHACDWEIGADAVTNLLQFSAKALGQAAVRSPADREGTAAPAESGEAASEGPPADAPAAAAQAESGEAAPEGPPMNASAVLEHMNATQLEFLLHQAVRALVPKDLKPLSAEDLRALNASSPPGAALLDAARGEAGDGMEPEYPGWYCGAATRFDVAAFLGVGLTVEQCYIWSCVEPYKVSSTCGPYFYTNGQGNCKCCDSGSTYARSSWDPPNNLYRCR